MKRAFLPLLGALAALACAVSPLFLNSYGQSLLISVLSYTVLATAWALFSGPTRFVSLATVAFFGVGAYTVAILGEAMVWPLVLVTAAAIGAVMALAVGFVTLRLSGIHFVIFTFGLAELIRQLVTWVETNVGGSIGRFVFLDITQAQIIWQLTGLAALLYAVGWAINRSRFGLALRMIGDDEGAAAHCGVDVARAKVLLFVVSATFMTLVGAIMAPRWTYIDPQIAFNPSISFQVLIMALLGGAGALLGPVLGVIPLTLLFEILSARFPNHFSILLGASFLAIVYFVPRGVLGLISGGGRGKAEPAASDSASASPSGAAPAKAASP